MTARNLLLRRIILGVAFVEVGEHGADRHHVQRSYQDGPVTIGEQQPDPRGDEDEQRPRLDLDEATTALARSVDLAVTEVRPALHKMLWILPQSLGAKGSGGLITLSAPCASDDSNR